MQGDCGHHEQYAEHADRRRHLAEHDTPIIVAVSGGSAASNA
jgi:hypothetical protein